MVDDIVIFRDFRDFDFETNEVYKSTLEQVLNQYLVMLSDKEIEVREEISNGILNTSRIPTEDLAQLELQTKCFVFCQETGNIMELDNFKHWIENGGGGDIEETVPNSYDEIVELIVNNKPVPGIKEISDIVLDPEDAPDGVLPHRKKPWEQSN